MIMTAKPMATPAVAIRKASFEAPRLSFFWVLLYNFLATNKVKDMFIGFQCACRQNRRQMMLYYNLSLREQQLLILDNNKPQAKTLRKTFAA
jgi:hypothetical protein